MNKRDLLIVYPNNRPNSYYSVGLLDSTHRVPSQMCYSNKCKSQGMSMCRYPYYPSVMSRPYIEAVPTCDMTRYLYTV